MRAFVGAGVADPPMRAAPSQMPVKKTSRCKNTAYGFNRQFGGFPIK